MSQVPPTEHTHAQPTEDLTLVYIHTNFITTIIGNVVHRRRCAKDCLAGMFIHMQICAPEITLL